MELVLSALSRCIANLVVFSAIPLIWWLIRHRKEESFFHWIGLRKPHIQVKWYWLLLFAAAYLFLYNFDGESLLSAESIAALNSDAVAANEYAGLGMAVILPAFLSCFVANGVAEEILFRGFFCKRFSGKFGKVRGSLLQAFLFGMMHVALVALSGMAVGADFYLYEFAYTFLGALMLGIANEKLFDGSIWPGICLHGLGNFISDLGVAFLWW